MLAAEITLTFAFQSRHRAISIGSRARICCGMATEHVFIASASIAACLERGAYRIPIPAYAMPGPDGGGAGAPAVPGGGGP